MNIFGGEVFFLASIFFLPRRGLNFFSSRVVGYFIV